MKTATFIITILILSQSLYGQHLPDGGIHKVHIDRPGLTADAEILPVSTPSRLIPDRWYSWYAGGEFRQTQGGFSGQLLHGAYHSFYENGAPMESGTYTAGLKSGVWRNWGSDGTIRQVITYQDGQRSGPFSVYNESGLIRQRGTYKNNLLEGAVSDFTKPDSASITWYHRGSVVEHRPFLKRLNPFNKLKSDTSTLARPR